MNKRRRLVGILGALATTAALAAIALPANALTLNDPVIGESCAAPNLVVNCGFETTNKTNDLAVPGWTHLISHDSYIATANPFYGTKSLAFVSTGQDDVFTQTITVAPHSQYLVGAQIDALGGASPSNDFTFAVTNINGSSDATALYKQVNISQGWQQVGGIVTTTGASTITLVLSGANVPAATYVDDVFVIPAARTGCAAIANNLVKNCGFEATTASPWVLVPAVQHSDSQISSNSNNTGHYSLRIAGFGVNTATNALYDDAWHQALTVRPHTAYTLSYWVEYSSAGNTPFNDLTVAVSDVAASGGSLRIATRNVPDHFWEQVTRTFTTGGSTSARLMIAGANKPSQTLVDDVSITAVPHVTVTARGRTVTTTLTGLGGQKVELQKLVGSHWVTERIWTAPKTGWSKSWITTVAPGAWRAVALAAPGYGQATSHAIGVV